MKTKTIIFGAIMMLAFAMFASALVLADDNSTAPVPMLISANPNANDSVDNITTTSEPAEDLANVTNVGSGTIFWKEVGLWFTFNQENKMNKEMDLAQLRLQQAEYDAKYNKTDAAEKALDAYQKLVDSAKKRSELITSKDTANVAMVKLAAMDQAIAAHEARITKLSNFLANANLTADQKVKIDARLAQAQNVTAHLQDVQTSKEDKIRTRLMAQGNLTEDQAQAMIDNAKEKAFNATNGKPRQAWQNFRNESAANNMTVRQYATQQRQEVKNEIKARIGNRTNNRTVRPMPVANSASAVGEVPSSQVVSNASA